MEEVRMRLFTTTVLALALCAASVAQASTGSAKEPVGLVQLDVQESAGEQLARVEKALGTEEYSEIGAEDKGKVQAAIGRIREHLGDRSSPEEVNPDARTLIFNDQELINTILSRAHADSRMVCRRERSTGSNRPQQVCMTVAQRREATENARDALRNYHRVNPRTDSR